MEPTIQPWVRWLVCAGWFAMCAQISQGEFEAQLESAFCTVYDECLGETCAEPDYVADSGACTYDARAAEACVEGWSELTCDQFFEIGSPAACEDVYTDCDTCEDDALFEDMDQVSEGVFDDEGVLCSNVDTDVSDGSTTAGNPAWGPWDGGEDHTEFYGVYGFVTNFDQNDIDRIARRYNCGVGINAVTGCDAFGAEFTPGEYVVVGAVLEGPLPLQDTVYTYQYGFVFDRDDDSSNNLVAQPPFEGDFFQSTDYWIVLQYTPFIGWFLDVVELRNGVPQPIDAFARVIIRGNSLTSLIPKSALPAAEPGYRATVHGHQGDFGEALPTTADTEPPIEEELRKVTADASGIGGEDGGGAEGGEDGSAGSDVDGGGCGCTVSPATFESNAVLALFVLLVLMTHRMRQTRSTATTS